MPLLLLTASHHDIDLADVERLSVGADSLGSTVVADDAVRGAMVLATCNRLELYLDTAITAAYALRQASDALSMQADKAGTLLVCRSEIQRDDSARQRLFDDRSMSYWPRLVVTDADRSDDRCPPECFEPGPPGGRSRLFGAKQIVKELRNVRPLEARHASALSRAGGDLKSGQIGPEKSAREQGSR